jgi:hypothetical protein
MRLGVIVITLIILLFAAVQIFLWSEWPRRIAITQIQNQLGARAEIQHLSISWLGHTRLQGLTLTLPLANEPVVKLDEVLVEHASLPVIAFTQNVSRITVSGARIDLRQELQNRWNVQQLLPVAQAKSNEQATPNLPTLVVNDAHLTITTTDGKHGEVNNISISGKKTGPLAYQIVAAAGDSIALTADLSLTREMTHEARLQISQLPPGLDPIIHALPRPLVADLSWNGRMTAGGIAGELLVRSVSCAQFHANGSAAISTNDDKTIRISPSNLELQLPSRDEIVLESGTITMGQTIRVERLQTKLSQGRVAIQGEVDPAAFTGQFSAAWQQVQQKGVTTTGMAEVKLSRELTGEFSGNAVFTGSIETPSGSAIGSFTLTGKGRALEEFDASLDSQPFTWQPASGQPIAVPALAGHASARGSRIVLDSLRPRDAQAGEFLATAEFNREMRKWWASVHTRELDVSQLRLRGLKLPVDLNLNVDGTFSRFDVRQLYLKQGNATLYITGFYDAALPKPVKLDTWCWYSPKKESDEDASFEGFHAHGQLAGTLSPRVLSGKGTIDARNLVVRDHVVGDVTLDMLAQISDWNATFSTAKMKLLEGEGQMLGEWTAFSDRPPRATITWKNIALPAIGDIAKVQGLEGTIESGQAVLTIPSFRVRDWTMKAIAKASNLKARGVPVDSLQFDATLDHGSIVATSVLQRQEGRIDATINATLATEQPIKLAAEINQWPAPTLEAQRWSNELTASVSGKVDASYLIAAKELTATTHLTSTITRSTDPIGSAQLAANLKNTQLNLEKLYIQTLDGTAEAAGDVDLMNLETTRLDFIFNRLRPSQLTWVSPVLGDVAGNYTGSLRIGPSIETRALGPVRIDFMLTPEDGAYKTVSLGEIRMSAFAEYESPREWRLVTGDAEINIAGGKVRPFARLSRSTGRQPTQLLTAELSSIHLAPIVRAYKDDQKEVVGEVTGQVQVFGSTRAINALTAEADVRLTRSDLGNFGPIAAMYNVLHIGGDLQPNGSGRVVLRLEDGQITIPTAYYFNRGAYINGFGKVSDVTKFPDSPLDLTLFGSLRPLRDINLPFFADADKLFSVIQSAGTTIRATGTVHDPKAQQVAFKELGETVQGVLLGKIKEEKEP